MYQGIYLKRSPNASIVSLKMREALMDSREMQIEDQIVILLFCFSLLFLFFISFLSRRSGYWGLRDTTDDPWTLSAPRNKTRRAQMARYVAATSMQLPVMPTRDISYSPPSSPPSTSAPGPIRSHTTSVSQCSTTLNSML